MQQWKERIEFKEDSPAGEVRLLWCLLQILVDSGCRLYFYKVTHDSAKKCTYLDFTLVGDVQQIEIAKAVLDGCRVNIN